jgi:hypothetical protein
MARTKHVSGREQPPKRKASSTHSSQEDSRPHKAAKQDDHNSDASGSEIVMISSRDLQSYRKRQRQHGQQQQQQQPNAQPVAVDEFTQPRGIRPPTRSEARRRARAGPGPVEREENAEEEEYYVSYGGSNEQERDQRIYGWAGSVVGAGAGDPDVGVEYDDASVISSSPSASGVTHPDQDGKTEEEDAIPSIETGNARASAQSNNRTVVPAQRSGQTLRRSIRVGRGTRILTARLPDPLFDPVAHLSEPAAKTSVPLYRLQKASIKCRNSVRCALPGGWYYNNQETLAEFLDRTVPKNQRLNVESNAPFFKTSNESRNSSVGGFLGASKQNAAFKYFDRDDPANHAYTFASNTFASNDSFSSSSDAEAFLDRDDFPVSFGGSPFLDEASSCAFSDCPCHHVTASRFFEHHVSPSYSETWIYRPNHERGYSFSPDPPSPSVAESYHGHNYSSAEQHSLDYRSEPHEDRDYFPMQTCSLDYDGDAQTKEEPASETGGTAHKGDGSNYNKDAGSASGVALPTTENNAGQQGSDDEDPEDEEQDHKSENDDSSSSNSDDDHESEESDGDSEEEMEIEEDDFCKEDDTGSLQDDADKNSGANNTVIGCTNRDLWGRIRPPGFQNRPDPPSGLSDAVFYRSQAHQYTAPSTMYYATNSAAAIKAASKRHGYDLNGVIRPPQRPAGRPRKGFRLAQRGGLPDVPFAGPQMRQNTAPNMMFDEPLSLGQGFVSVPIAEQQAAQMLLAHEGGEGECEDAEVDRAEGDGAEDHDGEDGDAAGHDGNKE